MKYYKNILNTTCYPITLFVLLWLIFLLSGCAPEAQVEASITSGQVPLKVSFTNTSKNADEFQWDFGDGITMTSGKDEPVTHEYTKAGTHVVVLTAVKRGNPPKTNTIKLSITTEHGPLESVQIVPDDLKISVNQSHQITALALDIYGNLVPTAQISWIFAEELGDFTGGVLTTGTKSGFFPEGITATAELNSRSAKTTAPVTILPGPVYRVNLEPEQAQIFSGESKQFTAAVFDSYDNRITEAQITWNVTPQAGKIDNRGTFTAGTEAGIFPTGIVVTARMNGYSAQASGAVTVHANIALNAGFTLHGGEFFTGGWPGGQVVGQGTVVDGIFLPEDKQWNQGPVWWDGRDNIDRHFVISLGRVFSVNSLVVQADNNDIYLVYYWNQTNSRWQSLWQVPRAESPGIQTRPNPNNNAERYELPNSITTNALLLRGDLQNGDRLFSVSEIQVFGYPVLESDAQSSSAAGAPPQPWLTSSLPPTITLSEPHVDGLSATINGITLPGITGAAVARIHWDWGDGSSDDQWFPASHTYKTIGSYIVTATSYQSDGLSAAKSTTFTTTASAATGIYSWSIATDLAPFTDSRLREAICLTLDEDAISAGLSQGKNVKLVAEREYSSEKYNLDRAKSLLREAGYPNGFLLAIYAAPSSDDINALVLAVSESLKKAGIISKLTFFQRIEEIPRFEFSLIIKPAR